MNSSSTTYLVTLAYLLSFTIFALISSTFNSTTGQFGVFIFIPAAFLILPTVVSKKESIFIITFNGLLLDYHNNIPLGFCVFTLLLIFVFFEKKLSFTKISNFIDNRILLLVVNIGISFALFLFTKLDQTEVSGWTWPRFLVDISVSSIVLFCIFNPLSFFLEQFTSKVLQFGPSNSSHVK